MAFVTHQPQVLLGLLLNLFSIFGTVLRLQFTALKFYGYYLLFGGL